MKRRRSGQAAVLTFHTREWYERAGAEMRLAELLAEMKALQAIFADEKRKSQGTLRKAMDAMKAQARPARHLTIVSRRNAGG